MTPTDFAAPPDAAGGAAPGPPARGRPRSAAARAAVLDAAVALLEEGGYAALTVEAVAARAGVGKQTVYRWWPSKAAVVLEALGDRAEAGVRAATSADWRADLERFLVRTFAAVRRQYGPMLRALMAEAQRDPAFAAEFRRAFVARRRSAFQAVLRRGQEAGDLRPDADLELLTDLAYGVLWYRLLLGHNPLSAAAARGVAAAVVAAGGVAAGGGGPTRA